MSQSFLLHPVPPFRLDYTVLALRRRAKNLVDRWDGKCYTRLFVIDNQAIKVTVEQKSSMNKPKLLVTLNKRITKKKEKKLLQLLEMMLGLQQNMQGFYQIAQHDKLLKPLAQQFIGLKPPRFSSVFEALVNAISCQQISLDAGLEIQNRLIMHTSAYIRGDNNHIFYAFPEPKKVAKCSMSKLRKIGYSKHKAEALIKLAAAVNANKDLFDNLENETNEETFKFLSQFKGIGRWSAEYALLRGLGRLETFPGNDIGAQRNLQQLLQSKKKLDYEKIAKITGKWYPYAGFVYFHLLLHKLDKKGLLSKWR